MTHSQLLPTTRRGPYDAVTVLSLYLVLLLALPARLIFAPLGGAGTPAQLLAIAIAAWWLWDRSDRWEPVAFRPHPIRRAMLLFVCAVLLSDVAAMTRAISVKEVNSAGMGLMALTGWLGVVLVCDEGVTSRLRLDLLLRRIALGGGVVASLGLVQFATGKAFTDLIQVPGLSVNNTLTSVLAREGFFRPSGTALHPIEFGVAMAVLLPIGLHVAMQRDVGSPVRRWFPVVAMAGAIPLSISRSAILGVAVALAVLLPTWPRATRRLAYASIGGLVGLVFVAVPGMLGTITRLFTGITQDSSALSRTDGYGLAWEFIIRSPFAGRGFMTFLPEYRILDNQYLGLLIDTGVLGTAALLGLFATGFLVATRRRRMSADGATRSLAQSLAASVSASAVCFAFFDAFSFPMVSGLTFLVLGLVAALETTTWPAPRPPQRILAALVRGRHRASAD